MENAKSIIYGNVYQNRYGRFLPVCGSITDRAAIQAILEYLKDTPHFRKYNRMAYAYRVEEVPVVFITEKKNVETQHYQGSHSDETIEGSGHKLLHLLEKFNIRNVFIGILIQQFNPLFPFETTNYRAIVENCRLLLDELYKKVVAMQDQVESKSYNDLLLHTHQTAKVKKCNLGETVSVPTVPVPKKVQRPNHIYANNNKPGFLGQSGQPKAETSLVYEIKFLWERCKIMKEQFEQLTDSLETRQLEQLKYMAMYDKDITINQVIKLFCISMGVDRTYLMNEYNFEQLKQAQFQIIEEKTLKKLDDSLKANRKVNVDAMMKNSRAVGILFSLIDLKIRFSKTLRRIGQLMQKSSLSEKELEEVQKIKQESIKSKESSVGHTQKSLPASRGNQE